ncbi:YpmA family protein [Halalkalibacter sp. APA_J-10(15)]|uniref:YpmA family protein n=1 Tax=unclassified Halalkalibacter TaxID=2893063 RepID=UPI001FF21316|nr:YpmA family protein [Halalkalibacter sp. APA_J-10(15)]MCK0472083.1 YpmA family protein [Halalkalibacter sp. APA_J-10(15)]
MEQKMEVLSKVTVKRTSDLYKIVDSLNRTLKEQDLMFGLALDQKNDDKMVFTIYRT